MSTTPTTLTFLALSDVIPWIKPTLAVGFLDSTVTGLSESKGSWLWKMTRSIARQQISIILKGKLSF